MKKVILSLIAVIAVAFSANAANYKVDNNAIDALIENSVEVLDVNFMAPSPATPSAAAVAPAGSVNPVVAIILNAFLGEFGIHRHYMGTSPWMWAIYTFTAGGIFFIVPTVDFIINIISLIDTNGIDGRYIGNTRFIVWL